MKRREFWKFLAASPAALAAPLLAGARPSTEVRSKDIVIEGNNVTVMNCRIENAGIQIKGGSERVGLSGLYVTNDA